MAEVLLVTMLVAARVPTDSEEVTAYSVSATEVQPQKAKVVATALVVFEPVAVASGLGLLSEWALREAARPAVVMAMALWEAARPALVMAMALWEATLVEGFLALERWQRAMWKVGELVEPVGAAWAESLVAVVQMGVVAVRWAVPLVDVYRFAPDPG